jgi:transporter family-2 protein
VQERLLLAAVLACGGLLGLQARINGELGARVGSALDAATVSFGGGTLLLLLLVGLSPRHRAAVWRLRSAPTRWWWWVTGGVAGATVVAMTAEAVPRIGVALVTVCVVAGTAVGGLGVDQLGLGPGGRKPVTALRITGAALAVVAVTLGAVGDRHAEVRPLLFTGLFLAGAGSALQQAANGQLRRAAMNAWLAGLVSFAVGTVVLVVAASASGDFGGRHWPHEWWLYTGGPMGVVFIVTAAALVQRLGVLTVSLATVAGQLVSAVILDVVWPAPGTSLRASTAAGALLTVVAVTIAARAPRSTAPAGRARA